MTHPSHGLIKATKNKRKDFEPEMKGLKRKLELIYRPKGSLTYLAYSLGISYFKGRESYTAMSDAISALDDAAEEIRRRHLVPYERKKIVDNGDVT